jgi:hypothetical protein
MYLYTLTSTSHYLLSLSLLYEIYIQGLSSGDLLLMNVGVAILHGTYSETAFRVTIACILREEHNHSLLFIHLLPPFHIVEYNISYIHLLSICFDKLYSSITTLKYSGLCCMPKKRRGGRLVLGG